MASIIKSVFSIIDHIVRGIIKGIERISPSLAAKCLQIWNNQELVSYLFVGIATTVVNYVVYYLATRGLQLDPMPGTWVAWIVAVIFGYWSNKTFVFKTHSENIQSLLREMLSFFSMRIASLGIETVLMFITVKVLHMPDLVMKLLINIIVIILNYLFSKLFVFRK